jgi:hypothetical protein
MAKIPLFIISSSSNDIYQQYKYFDVEVIESENIPFSTHVENIKQRNLPLCLVMHSSLIMLSEEKVVEILQTPGWNTLYLYRYNHNCHRQKILDKDLVVPYTKDNYLAVGLKNNTTDHTLATAYNLFTYNTIEIDDVKNYNMTNMCITENQIVNWPNRNYNVSYNYLPYIFFIFIIVFLLYYLKKK